MTRPKERNARCPREELAFEDGYAAGMSCGLVLALALFLLSGVCWHFVQEQERGGDHSQEH